MTAKALAYLQARAKILQREQALCVGRSLDKRASRHTQRKWQDLAAFARDELHMVNEAIAELDPNST